MESKIKISTRALWLLVAAVLALTLFAGLPAEKARAADGGTYVIRVSKSSSDYGGYGQSASEFVVQSGGSDVGQVYCASVGRRFAGSADGTARVGDTASLAFYDIDDTTANPRLSSADRLLIKKALYYGAGGPEDILTSALGFDQAYQITHFVVAAADGYSNPSEPLPTGGDMASFRSTINGKDDPPDSFHV